jgi:hypothetical protein
VIGLAGRRTFAVVGAGFIRGVFAFLFVMASTLVVRIDATIPFEITFLSYGLSIAPACVVGIWFRRTAAIWLIGVAILSGFGFFYQEIVDARRGALPGQGVAGWIGWNVAFPLAISAVPAVIGMLLLWAERDDNLVT